MERFTFLVVPILLHRQSSNSEFRLLFQTITSQYEKSHSSGKKESHKQYVAAPHLIYIVPLLLYGLSIPRTIQEDANSSAIFNERKIIGTATYSIVANG